MKNNPEFPPKPRKVKYMDVELIWEGKWKSREAAETEAEFYNSQINKDRNIVSLGEYGDGRWKVFIHRNKPVYEPEKNDRYFVMSAIRPGEKREAVRFVCRSKEDAERIVTMAGIRKDSDRAFQPIVLRGDTYQKFGPPHKSLGDALSYIKSLRVKKV